MTRVQAHPAASGVLVDNVSKVFGGEGGETVALQGANLEIRPGEFISLIGPSGCGKTTLLRLIADLEQPTGGALHLSQLTPKQAREARAYGYIFQAPALMDWRTVLQNVTLPLRLGGVPKAESESRARAMLELVGLGRFGGHRPWQLSGGMQQRVSIARALALNPGLLLMDEPFGALDEITREHLNLELLKLWQDTAKTVVFVTHSISEAVFLSTRIVVMTARPGRISDVIEVDLPQPRGAETRELPRFFELCTEVRERLREGHA